MSKPDGIFESADSTRSLQVSITMLGGKIVARHGKLPKYGNCSQCMVCGVDVTRQPTVKRARERVELYILRNHTVLKKETQ